MANSGPSPEGSAWAVLRSPLLTGITLVAFALRVLRIEWQPLWWDEGYSVFFATEPLSRMLALTARDIHPPLYYAGLHGWSSLLHSAGPATLRFFSIGAAVVAIPLVSALAGRLSHGNIVAVVSAGLLLALNPMHLYYSQEVRMYSLAATLGIASSYFLVTWVRESRANRRGRADLVAYALLTIALLYTLYYSAILIAVQLLWAAWTVRRSRSSLAALAAGGGAIALLYLPWIAYALPRLAAYIADKIVADQDSPLPLGEYVLRHIDAFIAGHVAAIPVSPFLVAACALAALVPVLTVSARKDPERTPAADGIRLGEAIAYLSAAIVASLLAGYLINLRFPFFPSGGERLLLFALPYLLTLIALGLAFGRIPAAAKAVLVAPVVALSLLGNAGFYTQPRHSQNDYRTIVRSVEERGSFGDTILAVFPWQVGYWRAYGHRDEAGGLLPPQPAPVGQEILTWDENLASSIDNALENGVVWFPEPLSLGSDLPHEIETYLEENALNVENQWQTDTTRLTAWTAPNAGDSVSPASLNFGQLRLLGSSISPLSVASDNSVLQVYLEWDPSEGVDQRQPAVQLADLEGRIWAERSYVPPVAGSSSPSSAGGSVVDRFGFQVPAGLPPGTYTVNLAVLDASGQPIPVQSANAADAQRTAPIQTVEVSIPVEPVPEVRIPLDHTAARRGQSNDLQILGVSGIGSQPSALAGSDLSMDISLRAAVANPQRYDLAVALADSKGQPVADWSGWTLPDYTTDRWPQNATVRVPVTLALPAGMEGGRYTLEASLVSPSQAQETSAVELATVDVAVRPGEFDPPPVAESMVQPVQFGTHARLIGYDTSFGEETIDLQLTWEVLQPLRPQHHIFVHVLDQNGEVIAQEDGPPQTSSGPAPTGSWRPGEYIATVHEIALPMVGDGQYPASATLRVGLYNPATGVRLPVSIDGVPAGDSAILDVDPDRSSP